MKKISFFILPLLVATALSSCSKQNDNPLPQGFVYLKNVDPSIHQNMRYASRNNFMGRPMKGYEKAACILTAPAAQALKAVQAELKKSKLSLMVYDCYRPQMAIDDIMAWTKNNDTKMRNRFYPNVDKADLTNENYITLPSPTSRGSTVELTIVPDPMPNTETYIPGEVLDDCTSSYLSRFQDGSIDMGTGFDCFDPLSIPSNKQVGIVAYQHRMMLKELMEKHGFAANTTKWWYFTLKNEPYPHTTFNFPVK